MIKLAIFTCIIPNSRRCRQFVRNPQATVGLSLDAVYQLETEGYLPVDNKYYIPVYALRGQLVGVALV